MEYTIQKGDNLGAIAQNNNTTTEALTSLNNIANPNQIREGQVIKLGNNTQVNAPTQNLSNNMVTPKPIPIDTIQSSVAPINLPVKEVITQSEAPNMAQDILNRTAVEETTAQVQARDLSNKISGLLPETLGETQALQEANAVAGVNTLNKNLTDINSQILMKQAELNKDDVSLAAGIQNIEDKPIAMEFILGEQAGLQRQAQIARAFKNAEIGILNARAIGLQGNIELAKQTAKEAVDAKYAPIKETINLYKAQLEALAPILSADEKKVAREQEIKTTLAMKEVDKLSKFQSDALSAAISNNAPQSVLNSINKAQSIEDISNVGSQWIISKADKLDQLLKQSQISKNYADMNSIGNVNSLSTEQASQLASNDPVGYFTQVIKQNKIKGSTTLESLLGVIGAAKDLADFGIEKGRFKGAAPIRFTPGFLKGEEQLTTQGSLDAINLKVQQWASGAALTEAQTKQVKRFTPDKNDTDKQIKTKLNNLTNFMIEQGVTSLANQGVSAQMPKIDLFSDSVNNISNEEFLDLPTNSSTLTNSEFFSN